MPRVASSNGIRPEYRALTVIKLNEPVTPSQINSQVNTGNYAAKYISLLKKVGFVFTVQKDGRNVVSYTLTKEPEDAEKYRSGETVLKKPKVTKAKTDTVAKKSRSNLDGPVRRVEKRSVEAKERLEEGEIETIGFDAYEESVSLRDLGLDAYA